MAQAIDQLPDDIDALKALVVDLTQDNTRKSAQIVSLQEQLNLALARRYAASSEKRSPDQIRLFDEAETDVNASANLYSLIETAKANGLEPYAYLRHIYAIGR